MLEQTGSQIMILSQINGVDPANLRDFIILFAGVLALAGCVLGIIYGYRRLFGHRSIAEPREISGQPIGVKIEHGAVHDEVWRMSQKDMSRRLDDHDRQIDQLWKTVRVEMPEMERRLNAANEERVSKVHERLNDVLQAVARLAGKLDGGHK